VTASLEDELRSATSLHELARRIGSVCLENERWLVDHRAELLTEKGNQEGDQPDHKDEASGYVYLEKIVALIPFHEWQPRGNAGFAHLLTQPALTDAIEEASAHSPIEFLAFIRGMCPVLARCFEETTAKISLDYGLPIPYATRPVNKPFNDPTPYQPHLANRELLRGTCLKLFPYHRWGSVNVTLDFSHRSRLDEITWTAKGRLPLIASMHPSMRHGDIDFKREGSSFFDVRPSHFSLQEVLTWLRSVKECEVAVLPELCLPKPDALAASLEATPSEYPPLIVAGSAHISRTDGNQTVRTNESHIYLDGKPVSVHRKIHPLETRNFGDVRLDYPAIENITSNSGELLVLSGGHTRLGVVICADLNELEIPTLLEAAGVNLLLVPVMTHSAGAFTGAISALASHCQAVCAVINADLRTANVHTPFLALVSVPQAMPYEQCRSYPTAQEQRPPSIDGTAPRAIFDPNLPLPAKVDWQ
jgi:hypothetical protein